MCGRGGAVCSPPAAPCRSPPGHTVRAATPAMGAVKLQMHGHGSPSCLNCCKALYMQLHTLHDAVTDLRCMCYTSVLQLCTAECMSIL